MAKRPNGSARPPIRVYFDAGLLIAGRLSPVRLQKGIRSRIAAALKGVTGLPSWADDAARTLPVIDIFMAFLAVLSVVIAAEIAHLSWLLPVAGWISALGVTVFALHWRQTYLLEVTQKKRAATVLVLLIVAAFLVLGLPIVRPIIAHFADVNVSVVQPPAPRPSPRSRAPLSRPPNPYISKAAAPGTSRPAYLAQAQHESPPSQAPVAVPATSTAASPTATPRVTKVPRSPRQTQASASPSPLQGKADAQDHLTATVIHPTPLATTAPPAAGAANQIVTWIDGPTDRDPNTVIRLHNTGDAVQNFRYWAYVNLTTDPPIPNVNAIRWTQCVNTETWSANADMGNAVTVGLILNVDHPLPYSLRKGSEVRWIYVYRVYENPKSGLDQDDQSVFQYFPFIPGYRALFLRDNNQFRSLEAYARNLCSYNGPQ